MYSSAKKGYKVNFVKEMRQENIKFTKKDFQILIPLIKQSKKIIIIALIIAVISSTFNLVPIIVQKTIIDDLILKGNEMGLIIFSILLIIVFILQWLITYIKTRSIRNVSQKIVFNLRSVVFNRILSLSLKHTNETKKGELLSVVMNDVNVLSSSFASGIIVFFTDIITLIGLTLVMIFLDVILTLIALLIALIIVISSRRYRKKVRGTWLIERENVALLNSNVEEALSGIRVVKALAVESKKKNDFQKLNKKNFDITMKGTQLSASFSALISIFTTLLIVFVIFIGGILFYFGNISLGDFIIFYLYTTLFIQPIKGLSGIYTTFQIAIIAIKHITKCLEKPNDVPEPENPIPLPIPFNGRVEYKDVSFSYTNEPFIENLNFIINSGEQIGIVGEMGAGKTTLIKLITRLYDVTAGTILLDGIDIRDLSKKELRETIAVVSQDTTIFADTVKNNLLFGNPEATDEQIIEAAKLSHAHKFIQTLPKGYDTILGDMGTGLSGGQKQLLAYTRLILAKPKIAILDEATSNLDSYTENLIQENMKKVLIGCTTIIIAHRFATIQDVERLILIDNGSIKAVGSHKEIYKTNKFYRELYDIQSSKLSSRDL
jgi:ABC-type multidrug transport system fused ATPase/permease subunit